MWRRLVFTVLGALAGYMVGAVAAMTVFAIVYGVRSISILEEANRNRWTFVVAGSSRVVGGLIGWWRSYSDVTGSEPPVSDPPASDQPVSDLPVSDPPVSDRPVSAPPVCDQVAPDVADPEMAGREEAAPEEAAPEEAASRQERP